MRLLSWSTSLRRRARRRSSRLPGLLVLLLACSALLLPVVVARGEARTATSGGALSYHTITAQPNADPLDLLSASETASSWSSLETHSVEEHLTHLIPFRHAHYIEVRLVGFSGETEPNRLFVNEDDFHKFFRALHTERQLSAIERIDGNMNHTVPIVTDLVYEVSKAEESLSKKLASRITSEISKRPADTRLMSLNPFLITELIKDDFLSREFSYSIYILNMPPQDIIYSYATGEDCASQMHIDRDRFMWIDLSAGPVSYGPKTSGDGGVRDGTYPRVHQHVHEDPSRDAGDDEKEQLIAELASLAQRVAVSVISPSLGVYPLPSPWARLRIDFLMIHDHEVGERERYGMFSTSAFVNALKQDIPLFSGQEIRFRTMDVSLRQSALLSSALQAATQTHTSTVITRDSPRSYVHSYLNSELLGEYLSALEPQIDAQYWSAEDPVEEDASSSSTRVIKVYLFDLSETKAAELLLLDRFHQATGSHRHHLVLGIQTGGSRALLDHQCMGASVSIDPRNATRALLAQTVNVAFGLASPERSFVEPTDRVHTDWRFSAIHSPYGPFSRQTTLPFFVRDAISRNQLYAQVDRLQESYRELFEPFVHHNTDLHSFLSSSQHIVLDQRLNFLFWAIQNAQETLSLHQYNHTQRYLNFAQQELRRIEAHLQDNSELDRAVYRLQVECSDQLSVQYDGVSLLSLLLLPIVTLCLALFVLFTLCLPRIRARWFARKRKKQ